MVERIRSLLERPLDPALARAIVIAACSLTVGFALVVALGSTGSGDVAPSTSAESPGGRPDTTAVAASASDRPRAPRPAQDPQDRPRTPAHRRAVREMAAHRALQHVPYRRRGIAIELVGARGDRAVLAVRAATVSEARRGYREFLRRYHDDGRSYLPRLQAEGGEDG